MHELITKKEEKTMSNIQISVTTRRISWQQHQPISEREVERILQPNITNLNGDNLTAYARIDLSRVDTNFPGLYHGTINVTDPNTNDSSFLNFDVNVLPTTQTDEMAAKQAPKKTSKRLGKKQKWLLIFGVILAILLGITACHHHNQQAAQQQQTNTQVAKNTKEIKSNADANAKLQKQLDALKQAQTDYKNDHDQQAYQAKINQLQAENDALKNQANNRGIADRLNRFGQALTNAEDNPTNDNYSQAQQAAGMNSLWNHLQGWFLNWLNQ